MRLYAPACGLCLSILLTVSVFSANGQNVNETAICPNGQKATGTMSVTGQGSVTSVPDTGRVVLRVEVIKPTADEARQIAATSTNTTISAIQDLGIPSSDIKTVGVSLSPNYVWTESPTGSTNKLEGYTFSQTLQVDVKNLTADQLGSVVDAAVQSGGDTMQVQSVETMLSPEKQATASNEARKLAVKNAMDTVKVLSQAANITMGPITSMVDQNSYYPTPQPMPVSSPMESADASLQKTPISVGTQDLQAMIALEVALCGNNA